MEPLAVDTNYGNNGSILEPGILGSREPLLMSVAGSQNSDRMLTNGGREFAQKPYSHVAENGSVVSVRGSVARNGCDVVERSVRAESRSSFGKQKGDNYYDDLKYKGGNSCDDLGNSFGTGGSKRNQKSSKLSRHNSINRFDKGVLYTENVTDTYSAGRADNEKGVNIRESYDCLNGDVSKRGQNDVKNELNENGNIGLGWSYVVLDTNRYSFERMLNKDLDKKKIVHENCRFGSCLPEIICDGNRKSLDPDHEHCRYGHCFVREALKYQASSDTDDVVQNGRLNFDGEGVFKSGNQGRQEVEINDEIIGKPGNQEILFPHSVPVSSLEQGQFDQRYLEECNSNKELKSEASINQSYPDFNSSRKRNSVSDKRRSDDHHHRYLDSTDNHRNASKNHGNSNGILKTRNTHVKGKGVSSYDKYETGSTSSHDSRMSSNRQRSKQSSSESAFQEFLRNQKMDKKQNLDLIQCMKDGINFADSNKSNNYHADINGRHFGPNGTNFDNFPSKEKDTCTDNGFDAYMSMHGTNKQKYSQKEDRGLKQGARDKESHEHYLDINKIDFDLDEIRNREYHVFTASSKVESKGDHSKYNNGAINSQSRVSEKDGVFRLAENEPSTSSFQRPRPKSEVEYGQLDVMFKHVKNDQFQMVLVADEMNQRRRQEQEVNVKIDRSMDNVSQENRTIYDRENRVAMLEHKEMVR